jgi:diguanylate cyclase (GGDEF)-like protein
MKIIEALKSASSEDIADDTPFERWVWLLSPHTHSALLVSRRTEMIASRVAISAIPFALLTPLWAVIEFFAFPRPLWALLAAGRLAATLGFVALLLFLKGEQRLHRAQSALWMLMGIPTLFYVYTSVCLAGHTFPGYSAVVATTHTLLPILLLTGLSIFPLTAVEVVLLALPVLLAKLALTILYWSPPEWPAAISAVWMLILITAVAMLAGISQLDFIIDLVHEGIRDKLTRCFSRASGEELLALQYASSMRAGAPLSIAYIDIDHFKKVNDEHGHETGDKVLIDTVRHIGKQLRKGDMLCRWGGEEFIVIMPNTDCSQALATLDRMRKGGLGPRPEGTPLTVSIGVAEQSADGARNWQTLVDMADGRMYQAKQAGRDKIVSCMG